MATAETPRQPRGGTDGGAGGGTGRDSHAQTRYAAVLVKDGSLLAWGTNGVPFPGEDHCYCKFGESSHHDRCRTHAEQRAITLAREGDGWRVLQGSKLIYVRLEAGITRSGWTSRTSVPAAVRLALSLGVAEWIFALSEGLVGYTSAGLRPDRPTQVVKVGAGPGRTGRVGGPSGPPGPRRPRRGADTGFMRYLSTDTGPYYHQDLPDRVGHLAVRLPGVGVRPVVCRAGGARHRPPGGRAGSHLVRHRRDLRFRAQRADPR